MNDIVVNWRINLMETVTLSWALRKSELRYKTRGL